VKRIPLSQGKFALVDDADFEELSKYKWFALKGRHTFYARRGVRINGKRIMVRMHRQILNASPREHVDHQSGDGLDNQRSNLRRCTNAENIRSQRIRVSINKSSRFRGVWWEKSSRKWRAAIRYNYKLIHLGRFAVDLNAAWAYDEAAKRLFGQYAVLNFK